jgi:hypothetical protein
MTVKEYNRSVEEFADSVYRFIRGNLKDDERANDIVQDSYERLWRTIVQNAIRLSLIGLSAAAVITLAVITYVSKPWALQVKFEKTAQTKVIDTTIQKLSVAIVPNGIHIERKIISFKKQNGNSIAA